MVILYRVAIAVKHKKRCASIMFVDAESVSRSWSGSCTSFDSHAFVILRPGFLLPVQPWYENMIRFKQVSAALRNQRHVRVSHHSISIATNMEQEWTARVIRTELPMLLVISFVVFMPALALFGKQCWPPSSR